MEINLTNFNKINFTDTCSIWNILSSLYFLKLAQQANCVFNITSYVLYECLYKKRKEALSNDEIELQKRLNKLLKSNEIHSYSLDISDLQDVEALENRKKLGKGELSSIVFAKKYGQSFLTDDQKARKLAKELFEGEIIQTTPHLFGWLAYQSFINDTDKESIIIEHNSLNRPLEKFFREVFNEALKIRLNS